MVKMMLNRLFKYEGDILCIQSCDLVSCRCFMGLSSHNVRSNTASLIRACHNDSCMYYPLMLDMCLQPLFPSVSCDFSFKEVFKLCIIIMFNDGNVIIC